MQDASMRMTAAQFPQAFGKRPIIRFGRAGYNKGRSTEIRSYKTTRQRVLAQSFLLQNRIGTGQSCGFNKGDYGRKSLLIQLRFRNIQQTATLRYALHGHKGQIGRASCRERVSISAVAGAIKKNTNT